MQIPPAIAIETARDELTELEPRVRLGQRKELHVAVGEESEDFVRGYELGLQTQRVMLETSGAAIAAGLEEIL